MRQEPDLFSMWGSVQRSLGRLEQGQVDMHREYTGHFQRLEARLDEMRRPAMGLLRFIPWDKVLLFAISMAGALGWLKPAWVRLFTALAGG